MDLQQSDLWTKVCHQFSYSQQANWPFGESQWTLTRKLASTTHKYQLNCPEITDCVNGLAYPMSCMSKTLVYFAKCPNGHSWLLMWGFPQTSTTLYQMENQIYRHKGRTSLREWHDSFNWCPHSQNVLQYFCTIWALWDHSIEKCCLYLAECGSGYWWYHV